MTPIVDDAERRDGLDAPLLRRTRWRLAAWSGGATLATLLVLGAILYVSLNAALSSSSEKRLEDQAESAAELISRFGDRALATVLGGGFDDEDFGTPQFGGPAAGTITILVSPQNQTVGRLPEALGKEVPVMSSIAAAREHETDIRYTTLDDTPVRVLSEPLEIGDQTWIVQILQDRTSEQRVLDTALIVLVTGGLVVLLAAVAFGFFYAGRALVPIRESLRRQREFAADASHELRTPISVIKAGVEDIRRNHRAVAADAAATLDDVEAEADRLTNLVDDLLLLARADSGRLQLRHEPVDLADAAGDAIHSLARRAEPAGVSLQLEATPTPVIGDPDRLRQLIGIIVDNAIHHSPAGAAVSVEIRPQGRQAIATIEDRGPGIRPEDLPRVFDRFWRATDAAHEGTGLGLAIARSIAQQHGGSITAGNGAGGGARFEMKMPLA